MKKIQKKEHDSGWVDVHNDALMVQLGIRNPMVEPRDSEVWSKNKNEKKQAKWARRQLKHAFDHCTWPAPFKQIDIPGKLIVQIKKTSKFSKVQPNGVKFYKTTFSHECNQSDIPEILYKYMIRGKNKQDVTLVKWYKWNGKTYSPGELPFWYGKN